MLQQTLSIGPCPRGLTDITAQVRGVLDLADPGSTGLVHLFVHHTSASLVIQENADPDVQRDLEAWFSRLVVDGDPLFRHRDEGPDDMSAHVKAALTATSLTIPLRDGRLLLGTWQGIYLWEHRDRAGPRRVTVTVQL